ncbi:uncharacterized protein LOC135472745 [Liolophura sinensis]|uniref:uncharacterized protein LOC135472745 n=1 Tax=Liolophura sinensis TaxID=3198878 RepID=UPI003158E011
MVYTMAVFLLGTFVFGTHAWGPTDCAYSVWSEWRSYNSGTFQFRTRDILRNARQGGQPCVGDRVEYRPVNAQLDPGFEGFLSMFLAGNAPSFNLAGGGFYTLSRDFVILLDTTVNVQLFPYYKSLVSNILGKVCGDFSSNPSDNRVTMASFDSSETAIHTFSDTQSREIMQDKVLKVPRSQYSTYANIIPAADFARTTLHSDTSGTRTYNNATKEVLLVTSSPDYCSRGLTRALNRLRTVAEVYILVIGRTSNSCLESLATSPTEFHFRQLEDVAAITDGSALLLDQSQGNNFCVRNTGGGQHY